MDIYVADAGYGFYTVMVDGKAYDSFWSTKRLTYSQMYDIAAGYAEYLEFGEN